MNRLVTLCGMAALSLIVAIPAAQAQTRTDASCHDSQRSCAQQAIGKSTGKGTGKSTGSGPHQKAQGGKKTAQAGHPAPRAGEIARNGQRFERAASSRFKSPGRGQEYRVVDEHLVLVDSNTLRIVSVLGLLNTLLK